MYKKICFKQLLLIVAVSTFWACSGGEGQQSELVKNDKGEILAPEERVWKNDLVQEKIILHSDIKDSLFNGGVINRYDDRLVVSDFGDMRLKRFDLDGKYIDSFGSKGRGPGEFQQPMNFDLSGSDTLYVLDARKMRLMAFNAKTTDFITSNDVEGSPYRMAVLQDNFIIETGIAEKLFYATDLKGNISKRFGQFMENQKQNAMSVPGDIKAVDNDTGFVFAPHYASYLIFYNSAGDRTKTIRTPDRNPFQKGNNRTAGDKRILTPPDTKVRTSDIDIFGGNIFVTQQFNGDDNSLPDSFIDVYKLESGRYLHSFGLPVSAGDVAFTQTRLYTLGRGSEQVQAYDFTHPN